MSYYKNPKEMYAEDFIKAWLKSEVLTPKVLKFKGENLYYEMLKPEFERIKKEGMKQDEVFRQEIEK